MSHTSTWKTVVQTGNWFASLPEAFGSALLVMAEPVHLKPGQPLFLRGDKPDGLYCVVKGVVRVTATSASGQEALLVMLEPPQ